MVKDLNFGFFKWGPHYNRNNNRNEKPCLWTRAV